MLKVDFNQLKDLPAPMTHPQAVIYRETLYVGGGETGGNNFILCAYNFEPDSWDTIQTNSMYYALAVYQDHLVLAGGYLDRKLSAPINQLWLTNNEQHTFKQTMPPMITATSRATAIATQTHLVVAGGFNGHSPLDIVQVCDGKQWTHTQPLPVPAYNMKYAIHNSKLYLIGDDDQGKKVFYTSLPVPKRNTIVWSTLADAPLSYSSIAVLQSQLVAIGGVHPLIRSSLHFYSGIANKWERMEAALPEPLSHTCSITLHTGELLVIGGTETGRRRSPHVYKATLLIE